MGIDFLRNWLHLSCSYSTKNPSKSIEFFGYLLILFRISDRRLDLSFVNKPYDPIKTIELIMFYSFHGFIDCLKLYDFLHNIGLCFLKAFLVNYYLNDLRSYPDSKPFLRTIAFECYSLNMHSNHIKESRCYLHENRTPTISFGGLQTVIYHILAFFYNLIFFCFFIPFLVGHRNNPLNIDIVFCAVVFSDFEVTLSFSFLLKDKNCIVIEIRFGGQIWEIAFRDYCFLDFDLLILYFEHYFFCFFFMYNFIFYIYSLAYCMSASQHHIWRYQNTSCCLSFNGSVNFILKCPNNRADTVVRILILNIISLF